MNRLPYEAPKLTYLGNLNDPEVRVRLKNLGIEPPEKEISVSTNPHDVRVNDEYVDLEFAHQNNGAERRIRILELYAVDGFCVALSLASNRKVSIRLDRLRPNKTGKRGYRLALRPEAEAGAPANDTGASPEA